MLDIASEKGISATCVRMGQACGSRSTGAWGTTEWVPIMVKSSIALRCLPAIRGVGLSSILHTIAHRLLQLVTWVPLDAIAQVYLDLVLADEALPSLVNLAHTRPTTWDVIARGIREGLEQDIPTVSLDDWVAKLEHLSSTATEKDFADIVSSVRVRVRAMLLMQDISPR